jgi:hypothetical protein
MKHSTPPVVVRLPQAHTLRWLPSLLLSATLFAGCNQSSPDNSVLFGKVVVAAEVDANNAPTALATEFSTNQKAIYVVAEAKNVAPGTRLAANWARESTVIQVSDEVIADKGYHNTNIEFHLSPGADGFAPGKYTVKLIVNGKPGPGVDFVVK